MDKKSKEVLRRYKKVRAAAASSSDSSSSSESESGSSSGSYTSSSSEKKAGHRKKQGRDSSTSGDERRKREKAHSCHQKKLEAKRNHLKKKLREAKAAKKRALTVNVMRRRAGSMSPNKLKTTGEKKHVPSASKERLRHAAEREKLRARERDRIRSRSPRTMAKLEAKLRARKSPVQAGVRHQLSPREKIIIQTRTRERTPDRKRELKIRHGDSRERERRERERAEREAERQKEREEALARCQERQRERERLAREKSRREKEKDFVAERGDRLLARPVDRDIALAVGRGYGSRERSLEEDGRVRHGHVSRIRDTGYDRERDYLASEHHRGSVLERDERRERDYVMIRRREVVSPGHYRDERDLYSEEERAAYARAYAEEERRRDRNWDPRELDLIKEREIEKLYPASRRGDDWPADDRWDEKSWGRGKGNHPPSEPDWDADEFVGGSRQLWEESREKRDRERALDHGQSPSSGRSGRWPPQEWRPIHTPAVESIHATASLRKSGSYRHTAPLPLDYIHDRQKYRPHPPPLMAIHSGYHPPARQFPTKRQMTYTNPNLKKKVGATPTTPGGTAIPSLLALPPIQPPTIDPIMTALEIEQPSVTEETELKPLAFEEPVLDKTLNEAELAAADPSEPTVENKVIEPEMVTAETTAEIKVEPDTAPEEVMVEHETAGVVVKEEEVAAVSPPFETDEQSAPVELEPVPDDLSEISDSDDEILDKEEEKEPPTEQLETEVTNDLSATITVFGNTVKDLAREGTKAEPADDDLLDFEEISDGELEEDSRIKGVGDALGVDWASLIKEAKAPLSPPLEQTTAKQKWQPHRIILDVGVSMKMADKEFAKHLLNEAKEKLDEEKGKKNILKFEVKEEPVAVENENKDDMKSIKQKVSTDDSLDNDAIYVNTLHSIACVQVREKRKCTERRSMIASACGPNSRALSARQDLKLRRRLCGLPMEEYDVLRPVSEKMKTVALALFQRTLAVK